MVLVEGTWGEVGWGAEGFISPVMGPGWMIWLQLHSKAAFLPVFWRLSMLYWQYCSQATSPSYCLARLFPSVQPYPSASFLRCTCTITSQIEPEVNRRSQIPSGLKTREHSCPGVWCWDAFLSLASPAKSHSFPRGQEKNKVLKLSSDCMLPWPPPMMWPQGPQLQT